MPRRIFPAGTVTNTTGNPIRLTFYADSTTNRRETDLWTVDGSNYLSVQIPNGVVIADATGAYSAFAGPDDVDVLYVNPHTGSSRTAITATSTVASGATVDAVTFDLLRPVTPAQRQPKHTMITTWASGHGWTSLGTGTWSLNYASDAWAGTQCVQVVTDGSGGSGFLRKTGLTAINLTGKDLVLWVKVTANLSNFKSVTTQISSDTFTNYYNNTIVDNNTYAANLNGIRLNEWFPVRFCINTGSKTGSPDITAITSLQFTVLDKGSGTTTIEFGGLGYYPRPTNYTNGVVSFTFDDTYATQYSNAAPALARYGWGATAYTIADIVGTSSYMTLTQLQDLQQTYGWEVAGHAYSSANHAAGYDTLGATTLDLEMRNLRSWLRGNGFTLGVDHLAYPLGQQNATTDALVKKYFRTGRLVSDNPLAPQQPGLPRAIPAHLGGSSDLATMEAKVDRAKADGCWTIFALHEITSGTASGNQFSLANLNTLLDYIATQGVDVAPLGNVWRAST